MSRALDHLNRVRDDPRRLIASIRAFYAAGLIDGEEPIVSAAFEEGQEAAARRGRAERVLVASDPVRRDGTAVTAVVVRADASDVHFHHVGPPGSQCLAPSLTDDLGTHYAPAHWDAVSASGFGRVLVGSWRYVPAAPPEARRFTIGRWWSVS